MLFIDTGCVDTNGMKAGIGLRPFTNGFTVKEIARLKAREVAAWRLRRLKEQGGKCALCGMPCDTGEAVLDHCHKSGMIRAVLHRGCNAWLGKVENSIRINKLTDKIDLLVAPRVIQYLNEDSGIYHPSWRTPEEKRLRRNKKARARRNANKKA